MAQIKVDVSNVLESMITVETKAQIAIKMRAVEGAKQLENYAKKNRRWTDRTGHARQRLTGWVETLSDKTRMYIGHGVSYGKWLELAHEKRYAILKETVDTQGKEILDDFKLMIEKMKV